MNNIVMYEAYIKLKLLFLFQKNSNSHICFVLLQLLYYQLLHINIPASQQ